MKCYKLLYDYENDRNYIDCDKAYIGKLNDRCMNKGIRVNVNSDIYFEYDSIEGEVLSDYIANVYGWFVVSELFVDTVIKCFDCKKLQIFPIAVIDRSNKKKTMSCSVINVLDVIDKAIDYDKSIYDIFCVGEKKVVSMEKYVLFAEKIKGHDIFRVKDDLSSIFVSDAVRDIIINNQLKGFDFTEVKTV